MRGPSACTIVLAVLGSAGCEQLDELRSRDRGDARLALSLEAPAPLDWGGRGTIRVSLENQADAATRGAVVEVYLPAWLEFGSVEPAGTEVTLVSGESGTRLAYRFAEVLQPGERRLVVQHVRVIAADGGAPRPSGAAADTIPPTRPAPTDRVIRARLVNERGEPVGAEVHAVLGFRGATDDPVLPPAAPQDAPLGGEAVGPVRLGMSRDELRRTVPAARDTVLGRQGGALERGMLVPLGDGRSVVAVLSEVGVERIIVRDRAFTTEQGLGVGARLDQLRQAFGDACAETRDGRLVARFASAPRLSFALSVAAPADTAAARPDAAALPDDASVSEIWVHRPRPGC